MCIVAIDALSVSGRGGKGRRRGVLSGIWPDIYNEEKERTCRQQKLQSGHGARCHQSERPSMLLNLPCGRVAMH